MIGEDQMPPVAGAWRGDASNPAELADEFAAANSFSRQFPGVEPIELVNITMSVENRDLVVNALRNMALKN